MHSLSRISSVEKSDRSAVIEALEPRIAPAALLLASTAATALFDLHHHHGLLAETHQISAPVAGPAKLQAAPRAAATTFPPVDGLTLTSAATSVGFALASFAKNFNTGSSIGPLGIAFPGKTGVLVSDYLGNVRLFPTDTDGRDASKRPVAHNFGSSILNLATVKGKVYLSNYDTGEIDLLKANGTFQAKIVDGLAGALGLVANPVNGHLFVQASSGIFEVDPVAKTSSLFFSIGGDGLAISPDGKTVYTASGSVIGIDTATKTRVFDSGAISGVDGTAVGAGSLSGFLFANTNNGEVYQVDLQHPGTKTLIASGGTRGDFVSVDPRDGSLLLTQSNEVVRLIPPAGGSFISTDTIVAGAGTGSRVQVLSASDGTVVRSLNAFEATYTGGVRVASGDVNGDGVADIIAGVGTGGRGRVRIFDGKDATNALPPLVDFRPFGTSYFGGVYVAAGDVNGDGKADLIVSSSAGSLAEVRVFDIYDGLQKGEAPALLAKFKIANTVNGGVRVAAGDLDGDGHADIVVTNGINAEVRVYHGNGTSFTGDLEHFKAFPQRVGGLSAAVGDFDNDGKNELAVGTASSAARVRLFPITSAGTILGTPVEIAPVTGASGVRLAVADGSGDGIADLYVAPRGGATVQFFSGLTHGELSRFNTTVVGGIFLG